MKTSKSIEQELKSQIRNDIKNGFARMAKRYLKRNALSGNGIQRVRRSLLDLI